MFFLQSWNKPYLYKLIVYEPYLYKLIVSFGKRK